MSTARFDELIELAQAQTLRGWDFTWLSARTDEEPLPWDYRALVKRHMRGISAMIDLGTGGGEFLASLAPFPQHTCATEGYPPNVVIARERLEPLGVEVFDMGQTGGRIPTADAVFDLVIDRHEGVMWEEAHRVLKPGGRLVTQQVGGENAMDLNRLLQNTPAYKYSYVTLDLLTGQLTDAGFTIRSAREAFPAWTFYDIASVVFYLTAVPWQIEDFSIEQYRSRLLNLHRHIEQEGRLVIKEHRLLVEAVKSVP